MNVIASRFPAVRTPLTEIDLCGWVGQAAPGDILEYHRGFLALDTMPHGTRLAERERAELARVARRAWWAAERGLIHLVQRRHRSDDYSYLAIARPKPRQASVSLSNLLLAEGTGIVRMSSRLGRLLRSDAITHAAARTVRTAKPTFRLTIKSEDAR